jgi:outer membrane usher protein
MFSYRSKRANDFITPVFRVTALACSLLLALPANSQTNPVETAERVLPLDVVINGTEGGIWPILERGGIVYVPADAFSSWRVRTPADAAVVEYRGLRYLAVTSLPGAKAKLEPEKYVLSLTVPAESFAATKLTRDLSESPKRDKVVPSVFFNYDLNHTRSTGKTSTTDLGLLGEAGWSTGLGVLTTHFVGRNLSGQAAGSRGLTRLETSFRRDFPDSDHTLTVGDSALRTGLLGRTAYFGGLQFGTNFALSPDANRQPVPVFVGETSSPSTVQLYVNNVLRQTGSVPAGPFALENLPSLSGNGQVTVVVRDILGRETLITQPFYATAELLSPGLDDWSVETGMQRRDLGNSSDRYGPGFVAGMWRRGISTSSTLEGRLEMSRSRRGAGIAGLSAVGGTTLTRGGFALSRDDALGAGHRWLLGLESPSYKANYTVMLEGSSRNFRSLGEERVALPPRLQLAAQASLIEDERRLSFGLVWQQRYDQERVATLSASYGTRVFNNWQLNLFVNHALARSGGGSTVGALLAIPLSSQTSTSMSMLLRKGESDVYASASHTPEQGNGLAWRALTGYGTQARAEGGAYYLGRHGQVSADVSSSAGQTSVRLGATGGLLYTSGLVFATARSDASAALVEVPNLGNVGVGIGGQILTRTDAQGYALLPRLLPYRSNPIRLDPNDLPFSAEIDTIEIPLVPSWRSVAKVSFPVRGGRGALLRIVLEDGEPAPAGATVRIAGDEASNDREFYVARRGEAYLTGLQASNRLQLHWKGATCAMTVELPAAGPDDITRVGPIACQGVKR